MTHTEHQQLHEEDLLVLYDELRGAARILLSLDTPAPFFAKALYRELRRVHDPVLETAFGSLPPSPERVGTQTWLNDFTHWLEERFVSGDTNDLVLAFESQHELAGSYTCGEYHNGDHLF